MGTENCGEAQFNLQIFQRAARTLGVENLASNNSRFCGSKASRREKWISPSWARDSLDVATETTQRKLRCYYNSNDSYNYLQDTSPNEVKGP